MFDTDEELNYRKSTMKIMCAYCGKTMGSKDGEGLTGISHSICNVCYEKLAREVKENSANIIKIRSYKCYPK